MFEAAYAKGIERLRKRTTSDYILPYDTEGRIDSETIIQFDDRAWRDVIQFSILALDRDTHQRSDLVRYVGLRAALSLKNG